jgi:hypothetical protein
MSDRWSLKAVQIDDTADVIIGGITQQNLNLGIELSNDASSGAVYPSVQSVNAQNPRASFTSYQIAKCLANIGVLGLDIGALATGLKLWAYKHAEGGSRATGSNHRSFDVAAGLIVPRTITINHQGDATFAADVFVTHDGTNVPVIPTDSAAIPAGDSDDERYTLGSVTIESKALNAVGSGVLQSMTIDFGIQELVEGGGSDLYPTHASIMTASPVITFTATNILWFADATIPLNGLNATHASTSIYLRKRDVEGGTFVADETEEHIEITAAGILHVTDAIDATQGSPATISASMPLRYDGSNDPMVIDTTAALP